MLEHLSGKVTRLTRMVAAEAVCGADRPEGAWFEPALNEMGREDFVAVMTATLSEPTLRSAALASAVSEDRAVTALMALCGEVLSVRAEIEEARG